MTESPLERLAAKDAIWEVLHRYCRGIDRLDRELAVSVWHPGGTALYEGLFEGTGEGFVDWLRERHFRVKGHSHQLTTAVIHVDGDRAVSETYGTVCVQAVVDADTVSERVTRGRYLDRWSRREGRWAIDHRQFLSDATSTFVVAAALADTSGHGSRRDRQDPSYGLIGPT